MDRGFLSHSLALVPLPYTRHSPKLRHGLLAAFQWHLPCSKEEPESPWGPDTSFLPSLLSLPALAHLLPLPHSVPASSWQRTRHIPATGPLHLLCVCRESRPLDVYITHFLRSLLRSQLLNGPVLAILA